MLCRWALTHWKQPAMLLSCITLVDALQAISLIELLYFWLSGDDGHISRLFIYKKLLLLHVNEIYWLFSDGSRFSCLLFGGFPAFRGLSLLSSSATRAVHATYGDNKELKCWQSLKRKHNNWLQPENNGEKLQQTALCAVRQERET